MTPATSTRCATHCIRQRQDDVAIDFPVAGPPAQANIREDDLSDHDKLAETEESMNDLELSDQLDDQLVANTDAPAEQHDAWTANQEDQSEHQSDDGMVLDEQTEFAQQVPDAPMAEEVSINEVEQNPILSPQANASPVPFCEGMPKCQDDMLEPDEAARGDDVENEEEEQAWWFAFPLQNADLVLRTTLLFAYLLCRLYARYLYSFK
eukprot:Skav215382  [mRNA]  locus=scaffold2840:13748:16146:- [translate_table: standard]